MRERRVGWPGFYNTWDLGGMRTDTGTGTRHGSIYRGAEPRFAQAAGWAAARDAGLRTVIDLRNTDELGPGHARCVDMLADLGITTARVPIEEDTSVSLADLRRQRVYGTPLRYAAFARERPNRCAAVLRAIGQAPPGGVLFHCASGRDRTGLVALLVLALCGVDVDDIAADHEHGARGAIEIVVAAGNPSPEPEIAANFAAHGVTPHRAVRDALAEIETTASPAAMLTGPERAAIRDRLVAPTGPARPTPL